MEEHLKIESAGGTVVARLYGEIDHHSAVLVRGQIDGALFAERPKTLVLDLGAVDFMDSSGLGLVMGRYTKTRELGASLVIRRPSVRAEKMLKIAGLDRLVRIEAEETDKERNDRIYEKRADQ